MAKNYLHTGESEEALLGAILIAPENFPLLRDKLAGSDFFELKHQWIWDAFTLLHDSGADIDYVSVGETLRAQKRMPDIGGASYLTFLINSCGNSMHAATYAELVRDASVRRSLVGVAGRMVQLAQESPDTLDVLLPKCESALLELTQKGGASHTPKLSEAANAYYERLEAVYRDPSLTLGVPSGITEIDRMMGGWQKANLYIIAGRPGMGKTSIMLTMLLGAARFGVGSLFLSYEMGQEQITNRLYSQITGISATRIMRGDLGEQEWPKVHDARTEMEKLPIWLETNPRSIHGIKSMIRRLNAQHPVGLVMIDYLQLIPNKGKGDRNREMEVSEIARGLKAIAHGMNIPVLAASQLSRNVENRKEKRPGLPDLRESGEIEQAADAVFMLYRDEYYNENTTSPRILEWIVAKNRHGETGTVNLWWDAPQMRVLDLTVSTVQL